MRLRHYQTWKTVSELLAAVAMVFLLLYIADAALEFFSYDRFLMLSLYDRGIIFGGGALALFIVSNAVIFMTTKFPNKLAPSLLVAGGTIIETSVIASAAILNLKMSNPLLR
jgi:hypothetical protein